MTRTVTGGAKAGFVRGGGSDTAERERIIKEVAREVARRVREAPEGTKFPADPGDLVEFGMGSLGRPRHPGAELIGPVYSTSGVLRLLDKKRQELDSRRKAGTVLAAQSDSGKWFYPAAQFKARQIIPGVREAAMVMRDAPVERWNVLFWFSAPKELLDGMSPLSWLRDDRPVDPVLRLARETVARWSA